MRVLHTAAAEQLVGCHGQIHFTGFPFITGLHRECGHEPQAGSLVGKHADHTGAPADLLVQALQAVGGAEALVVALRKGKYGQTFGNVHL